jgi:hypothetical protein
MGLGAWRGSQDRSDEEGIGVMALYDIAVGDGHQHERGAVLLQLLGGPGVARFRDAWVEEGESGPVIAIYTRQGGGNRECYCEGEPGSVAFAAEHTPSRCYAACNQELVRHPLYITDRDDEFDSTYATFYFRAPTELPAGLPEEFREVLAAALAALPEAAVDPVNTDERWKAAIDRIGKGETRPAETAMADQLGAFLSDPSPDGPKVMEI